MIWPPLAAGRLGSTWSNGIFRSNGIELGGNPNRNRRHVVVWRRLTAPSRDRLEDPFDHLAGRLVAKPADDLEESRRGKFLSLPVHRLEHAVGAQHEQVAGVQRECDFVVGRSLKRTKRHAGQFDLRAALFRTPDWVGQSGV